MKTVPPLRSARCSLAVLALNSLLGLIAILACGPDFPNMLLTQGDHAALVAPMIRFKREIERLYREQQPKHKYVAEPNEGNLATDTELADLHAALIERGLNEKEASAICTRHARQRSMLAAPDRQPEPITELPGEFAEYFRGAVFWRRAELEGIDPETRSELIAKAREQWEQLLRRPGAERKYKSTWAAYMIGLAESSPAQGNVGEATKAFRKVREFADAGFSDPLGLAVASFGQEALIEWRSETNLVRAIELYLAQGSAGDPTGLGSLRTVAELAFRPENARELERLANDRNARRVVTAYLVSQGGSRPPEGEGAADRWLKLLEALQVREVELAERLALAAYQSGRMELAKRWLARSEPGSFVVRWLSAKLLLYDGKVENAAEVLARLSKDFPVTREKDETQANSKPADDLFANDSEETPARLQVLGEVGVLRLARREYTEALDALLRSGFWMDASYVAERVLTLPELTAYVDAQWPLPAEEPVIAPEQEELEHPDAVEGWGREIDPNVIRGRIRYLLGRRLVRSHEEVKALAYLPEEWRVRLKEYLALAEAGRDPEQPARERARKLFEAAKLMREHGLELWGTEAAPDWFVYSGSFTEGVTVEAREAIAPENHLVAHPEEIARAKAHQPEPDKRFHYRYTAAQLGLEAAKLLPDNDDETALVLCTAGSWLKYCDPKAADPYYKTLVRRCRKTVIGKEADRIRWFPRIDENGKILPRPAPAPAAPVAVPPEALEQFPLAMR